MDLMTNEECPNYLGKINIIVTLPPGPPSPTPVCVELLDASISIVVTCLCSRIHLEPLQTKLFALCATRYYHSYNLLAGRTEINTMYQPLPPLNVIISRNSLDMPNL